MGCYFILFLLFAFLFCAWSITSVENLSLPFSIQKEITLYSARVLFGGLVKYLLKILDVFHLCILISFISDWPIINSWLMWFFFSFLVEQRATSFSSCHILAHKRIPFFFPSACRETVIKGNSENLTEQPAVLPEKHIFTLFGRYSWGSIALYSRGRISVVAGHCSSSTSQGKRKKLEMVFQSLLTWVAE